MIFRRFAAAVLAIGALTTTTACGSTGGLGEILGSVLGGGQGAQGGQVSGSVQSVDTRNQIVTLRQSNGQNVSLNYDNQTQVVYQNRNYAITDLESGDQVTATVQTVNNGYYVSRVQVDQSATSSGTSGQSTQSVQGTVRQVDVSNGWFTISANNNATVTVTMPYNPTRNDLTRFQGLRSGDNVRFYGRYLNSGRIELERFY